MTLLINIGTAFAVFIVSVVILSTNYKTVWPAPNFVTHSATFDYIFQDIATNSFLTNPIAIEYAYKSLPIATSSHKLINSTTGDSAHHSELVLHQSILEKQANLHHLLHIPPWALVPDRISSTSGSVTDLFKIFDSLRNKQENTLSILSDIIEISPTESLMKSHMEQLTAAQKFWLSNITHELFNASQTIFSYQLINYAEEICQWVQNSPYSNTYLRQIFERTRGWPLLYNPSIHNMHEIHSYQALCRHIIDQYEEEDIDDILTTDQCELFLDSMLPWMPDKAATLTTMWPTYYDVDVEALKRIKGINSPYTMVIKQNRKPSGEVLHYVSAKGEERIQVEWFNAKYHLRATNLAFVRRIRIQIKRMANILKTSVSLSGEIEEEDDLAAWWASLETEMEQGPKPSDKHIEQLSKEFKQYVKNYAAELEKGQFAKILNMDLAQNEQGNKIFIHGLPSIAVFNDGGIKRAWNFIIGVVDYDLFGETLLTQKQEEFVEFMDVSTFQSAHHQQAHAIELEIIGVWPYAVGGYLRGITPEVFSYTYPPFDDAKEVYGKQRCVLLLDVMEKLYSYNMRNIGFKRLIKEDDANRFITLAAMVKYVTNLLTVKHKYFHNRDDRNNIYSVKQGLFVRVAAIVQCGDDYGCVLSGVFYNIIEAFTRENEFSLVFIAFLEKEGLIEWSKERNKDVVNVVDSGGDIAKLSDNTLWNEWKNTYFEGEDDTNVYKLKNEFVGNTEMMKLYRRRVIRHVSKYAVVRRPGEDTFVAEQ